MKKTANFHNIDLSIIESLKGRNWKIGPLSTQVDSRGKLVMSSITVSKLNINFVLHLGTKEVEAYLSQVTPQGNRNIPLLFLNDFMFDAESINGLYSSFIKNFNQKN